VLHSRVHVSWLQLELCGELLQNLPFDWRHVVGSDGEEGRDAQDLPPMVLLVDL